MISEVRKPIQIGDVWRSIDDISHELDFTIKGIWGDYYLVNLLDGSQDAYKQEYIYTHELVE